MAWGTGKGAEGGDGRHSGKKDPGESKNSQDHQRPAPQNTHRRTDGDDNEDSK